MNTCFKFLSSVFFLVFSVHAGSLETNTTDSISFCNIRIEQKQIVAQSREPREDTVSVFIESKYEIGGFDFKIGTLGNALNIVEILPGQFIDSCEWGFFEKRSLAGSAHGDQILNGWKIVSMARQIGSTKNPVCYTIDGETELFRMVVVTKPQMVPISNSHSILFYWDICADNTVSLVSGDSILLCDTVTNLSGEFLAQGAKNSRFFGAPAKCITQTNADRVLRKLNLENGGVEFFPDSAVID